MCIQEHRWWNMRLSFPKELRILGPIAFVISTTLELKGSCTRVKGYLVLQKIRGVGASEKIPIDKHWEIWRLKRERLPPLKNPRDEDDDEVGLDDEEENWLYFSIVASSNGKKKNQSEKRKPLKEISWICTTIESVSK